MLVRRKHDLLSKEKREVVIEKIISYFHTERNETIGIIAAGEFLDMLLQMIAEDIYNLAIEDAKVTVKQSFENLEVNLGLLLNK